MGKTRYSIFLLVFVLLSSPYFLAFGEPQVITEGQVVTREKAPASGEKKQSFLPAFPKPIQGSSNKPITISVIEKPFWQQLAAVCFQGLANRSLGQVYLIWDESDTFWLDAYNKVGYDLSPQIRSIDEIPSFVGDGGPFAGVAKGLLIYDDALLTIQQPPTLMGQWQLNEKSGTVAKDSSGYKQNASLSGTGQWESDCFVFDGKSHFKVTQDKDFPYNMSRSFRISLSLLTTQLDYGTLFSRPNKAFNRGVKALFINDGKLNFYCGRFPGTGGRTFIADGKWHDVTVEFNAMTGSITLFVDGKKDCIHYIPEMVTVSDSFDLYLGSRLPPYGHFVGKMKNVLVHNYPANDYQFNRNHLFNVLTTIAGQEQLIPVPKSQASNWPLPVKIDASRLWNAKYDDADAAYQWVLNHYSELHTPQTVSINPPLLLNTQDYVVAHKLPSFFYWAQMNASTRKQFDQLMEDTGINQPVLGIWAEKNIYDELGGEFAEHGLLRYLSRYTKFFNCTNGVISNLSYHSALPLLRDTYRANHVAPVFDPDKVYVTLNITDGDNIAYLWGREGFSSRRWWADPCAGEVPINWTISPALCELMPGLLTYYYATATPKDSFSAAVSGVGYVMLKYFGKHYDQPLELLRQFYRLSAGYLNRQNLYSLHVMTEYDHSIEGPPNPGTDLPQLTTAVKALVPLIRLNAVLVDYHNRGGLSDYKDTYLVIDGVPCFLSVTDGCKDVASTAKQISKYTPLTRPAFLHAGLVNWCWTPTKMKELAQALGDDYVVVDADTLGAFFKLGKSGDKRN